MSGALSAWPLLSGPLYICPLMSGSLHVCLSDLYHLDPYMCAWPLLSGPLHVCPPSNVWITAFLPDHGFLDPCMSAWSLPVIDKIAHWPAVQIDLLALAGMYAYLCMLIGNTKIRLPVVCTANWGHPHLIGQGNYHQQSIEITWLELELGAEADNLAPSYLACIPHSRKMLYPGGKKWGTTRVNAS